VSGPVRVGLYTETCPVCGALVYVELLTGEGQTQSGMPADERVKHAQWHERTGTT
jgi:hypothetical protein